jgi:hypothetical protein
VWQDLGFKETNYCSPAVNAIRNEETGFMQCTIHPRHDQGSDIEVNSEENPARQVTRLR